MQYKIEEITKVLSAKRIGKRETVVNWLLIDSRSLCFPEETLFFAMRTQRNDGHRYIKELYKRGVRNFVVTNIPEEMKDKDNVNFLVVDDSLKALQTLAAYHRGRLDIPFVAITGSNGKTTVKEWLYQILSHHYKVSRSPRSYNSQIGVPLSVWLVDDSADIAIIETGISATGEMDKLGRIVKPTVGVITNVGAAHQENFLSYDIKCAEKLQLMNGCRKAVLNMTDQCIAYAASIIPAGVERLGWSRDVNDGEELHILSIDKGSENAKVAFSYEGHEYEYMIPFIDDGAIENTITCLAVCLGLMDYCKNLTVEKICRGMELLEPVAMRLEVKDGINGCTLINDTYNSDVHSLDIALDFMSRRPDTKEQKRTLIISDILQSGEEPQVLYSKVAQMAQSRGIDKVIGVGDGIMSCADFFHGECHFFHSTDELLQSKEFAAISNEFVLIKGARRFRFDKLSERLTLKVHQTILEVNLNALVSNVNHYRSFLKPDTRMVCMVKASAYGIGSLETSKTLQDAGVDYLAVAVADEGADLRKAGITSNIMIMNPEMTSFKMLFDYRLEPEVFNFQILEALIRAAEKEGITNFPIHIKLDTGMHRLGFNPDTDMERLINRLARQTALVPCSVFSHFVGSDDDVFDEFSRQQFAAFDRASRMLQGAYTHKIIRHICNSAGIEHFPEYHLDMVRLGIGLYGINPRDNKQINNVATLKTTILQIRDVKAGESIGYSRRTVLERDSRIAAIPIGYADGLNRRLGNRNCYCMVNGQRAWYVGNICMDVCMIDVTDIDCKEGDYAIVFGEELPVAVLSDAIGTIPYEVLTGISSRVQHVYVQE